MSSFLARGHRPRHRLKIEYLFLFEILSKIDLFMFIVKSMHYAPQLSGIVCAAWKVSGTFTTSATAVTTGKCSKGFEVSSIFCDLLKYWWLVLSCKLHGNNSTTRNFNAKQVQVSLLKQCLHNLTLWKQGPFHQAFPS